MNQISEDKYTEHETFAEEIRGQLILLKREFELAHVLPSAIVVPVDQRQHVNMWLVPLPRRGRWVGSDNQLYYRYGRYYSRKWLVADYARRDVRGLQDLHKRLRQQIDAFQRPAR